MAFKTLTILEKNIGDPLEVVAAPKRIAAPYYGTGGGGTTDSSCITPWLRYEANGDMESENGAFHIYERDASVENTHFYDTRLYQPYIDGDGNAREVYDSLADVSVYSLWTDTNFKVYSYASKYVCPSTFDSAFNIEVANGDPFNTLARIVLRTGQPGPIINFKLIDIIDKEIEFSTSGISIDGNLGFSGNVVAGQTMTFLNGLLISVT